MILFFGRCDLGPVNAILTTKRTPGPLTVSELYGKINSNIHVEVVGKEKGRSVTCPRQLQKSIIDMESIPRKS